MFEQSRYEDMYHVCSEQFKKIAKASYRNKISKLANLCANNLGGFELTKMKNSKRDTLF